MRSDEFWNYFSQITQPKLADRSETFEHIFNYLDQFDRPVGIVETGCVRVPDNWSGDGGSTILFDDYARTHPGSVVYTVDLDAGATRICLVSDCVKIHTGDSVPYLQSIADNPPADLPFLDLVYLDSYDLDLNNPVPSAVHHLKELIAISPHIRSETLIVVDDSPDIITGFNHGGTFRILTGPQVKNPHIGGKGMYIAEYAQQVGARNLFKSYQCGWTHMRVNKR